MGVSGPRSSSPHMKSSCPRDSTAPSSAPNRSSMASLRSRWRAAAEPTPYRKARSRASRIRRDSLPRPCALGHRALVDLQRPPQRPCTRAPAPALAANVMSRMWYMFSTSFAVLNAVSGGLHGNVLLLKKFVLSCEFRQVRVFCDVAPRVNAPPPQAHFWAGFVIGPSIFARVMHPHLKPVFCHRRPGSALSSDCSPLTSR